MPTSALTVPKLSLREQKILNYHVSKYEHGTLPVLIQFCVNAIEWSDLPHTLLQAKKTLETLESHGLIERNGEESRPTQAGREVMSYYKAQPHWPKNQFATKPKKRQAKKSTKKKSTTRRSTQ